MRLKSQTNNGKIFQSKADFRLNSRRKLEKIDFCKRKYYSKRVIKKLEALLKDLNIKNILLYLPISHEVDITPLVKKLRRDKNVYVPFMQGASFKLVKYRLPVSKKQFNIMEPPNSWCKLPKIDIAVVPVIGVDGMIRRVGFGKGMYDRYFSLLTPKPLIVFVQLTKCFTTQKLCEPFDVQADIYITPTDTIIKRGIDDYRGWNRSGSSHCYRDSRFFNSKKN